MCVLQIHIYIYIVLLFFISFVHSCTHLSLAFGCSLSAILCTANMDRVTYFKDESARFFLSFLFLYFRWKTKLIQYTCTTVNRIARKNFSNGYLLVLTVASQKITILLIFFSLLCFCCYCCYYYGCCFWWFFGMWFHSFASMYFCYLVAGCCVCAFFSFPSSSYSCTISAAIAVIVCRRTLFTLARPLFDVLFSFTGFILFLAFS